MSFDEKVFEMSNTLIDVTQTLQGFRQLIKFRRPVRVSVLVLQRRSPTSI